ncbi:hypothetical protein CDD81_116 [Ophiocordyceps australis]|uniref:Protein kinase domain-containing protein n=1 Tax=Ophiocordyceps australis TaxID=1399860 RepID=A0A2C5YIN0_9HYPO|nr:hypothetical protein CDD81_116 [Ophiocordyceps australis]
MADVRPEPSEGAAEEKTEPISQSEIEARLGLRVDGTGDFADHEALPLDILSLDPHEDFRILVRPLTRLPSASSVSPGSDSLKWLAKHKAIAVVQTPRDVKLSLRIPGEAQHASPRILLRLDVYYDPGSDRVILFNTSDEPISLARLSHSVPSADSAMPLSQSHVINPGFACSCEPGTWRITLRKVDLVDFRVLEKRPLSLLGPQLWLSTTHSRCSGCSSGSCTNSSSKRSLDLDTDGKRAKRRISGPVGKADDNVVMLYHNGTDPVILPPLAKENKQLCAAASNALMDVKLDETVSVPGVREVDAYQVTKRGLIASTALSSVYMASHSKLPDQFITVKVLQTRMTPSDKPLAHERNVIRQADMWLRECQNQESLQHDSIVRYHGGDARFLSLYLEHVEAPDLSSTARWRNKTDDFVGSRQDALRILRDIAGALSYIHGRQMVHNDIKPGNILYSPERGAVLCDFGLSTIADHSPSTGGTPYYVPPEFIGHKLRGTPSDVWALGVVMLYIVGKIKFPDIRCRRQHPRRLYWQIGGINNPSLANKQDGNGQPAVSQMRDWLKEVNAARDGLDSSDVVERLVKEMLAPHPNQRITMAKVVDELEVSGQLVSLQ